MPTTQEFNVIRTAWEVSGGTYCAHRWVTVIDNREKNGCVDCGWVVKKSDGDPGPIMLSGR
ncbi:hypothetical protein [Microbacterium sp. CFBP 8794]|uniref:hypothetical protein n=1 Tax=Microbacterium sp. CFBP 8794 TaxID=2775269 RepID=UPI001781D4EE|nr:hypothetical protein [Microbacterium sp. CFBP 8794]MBD8477547.1 hypothetical protein [Microbacterium sp. CFBP 8794]